MVARREDPCKQRNETPLVESADIQRPATKEDAEQTFKVPEPSEQAAAGFPVVGIGASAGGLAAFEAFFAGMPTGINPGMAFVLVQHLAPDRKSLLADLIRRHTRIQVFEVEDGMRVLPNCAYIIPPGHDMAFLNGSLQLLEPVLPHGQRLPVDFFFRSLAQDQHERAIGVILSGTGSDGTLGVRAIKGEGGIIMAQIPESAEYDGMPRSAIATGLVDFELPPVEMPTQLVSYVAHLFSKLNRPAILSTTSSDITLKKVLILLRTKMGHDFSGYKPETIIRRIGRRMAIHQIDTLDSYVKYLQQTPVEVESLFRNLLIGVTSFFRDTEAFKSLEEQIIPQLFAGKTPETAIRVWVPGCSTGEEAYSIAILLAERQTAMKQSLKIQVFATDIDDRAIATARAGIYPASIMADVSPERLRRFFMAEPNGGHYRIHKGIRDMLVFSEQNILKDPPFSKLDLISCRNLLIYLGGDLQKKIIPLFHYALKPEGFLFLGTSETAGEFVFLFTSVEQKMKLYQRKKDGHDLQPAALKHFLLPVTALAATLPPPLTTNAFPTKPPLRHLTERALLEDDRAAALVNKQGNILYLHGRTGMYLEPTPGEVGVYNILKMARTGLMQELTTVLHKVVVTNEKVHCRCLRVKTNGDFTRVDLTVQPIVPGTDLSPEATMYLVILQPASQPIIAEANISNTSNDPDTATELIITELRQELQAKEEYLQISQEHLETSNEELKSANEEMQSVNEELQSTNEELETSKEELQSVNEELATVNNELNTKVTDLSKANNDMNNLLAGTGIGTVFVDHGLRILRFTPATTRMINLIAGDVGRPVGHIVSNLRGYNSLVLDIQAVLDSLIPKEAEVQTTDGRWYNMRIQPYRTTSNVIEGAVITFINITELMETRERLRKANGLARLAVVVNDAHDAITVQDLEGRIIAWNPAAVRMYGWSEAEALSMQARNRIPEELQEEAMAKISQLSLAHTLKPYPTQRLCKDGTTIRVWLASTALLDGAGKIYAIATTELATEQ